MFMHKNKQIWQEQGWQRCAERESTRQGREYIAGLYTHNIVNTTRTSSLTTSVHVRRHSLRSEVLKELPSSGTLHRSAALPPYVVTPSEVKAGFLQMGVSRGVSVGFDGWAGHTNWTVVDLQMNVACFQKGNIVCAPLCNHVRFIVQHTTFFGGIFLNANNDSMKSNCFSVQQIAACSSPWRLRLPKKLVLCLLFLLFSPIFLFFSSSFMSFSFSSPSSLSLIFYTCLHKANPLFVTSLVLSVQLLNHRPFPI